MSVEVIHPGMACSLQDEGRYGYQQTGVPVCGAMDRFSHRLANILAGNREDCASLEMTLSGPTLRFWRRSRIAISGADLSAHINDHPVPLDTPLLVPEGGVLRFAKRSQGVRAYLAIHGGFRVPSLMNSQSTCLSANFGGYAGRYLQKGDQLPIAPGFSNAIPGTLPFDTPRLFDKTDAPIRVIAGRHWSHFSAPVQQRFLNQSYRITPESSRMGYRLQGEALSREVQHDIPSEAVDYGTIQVPPSGHPIVLMADAQTTGGYPKIAHVASVDLPRMAQMMPGQSLQFQLIGIAEAQQLAIARAEWFDALTEQYT